MRSYRTTCQRIFSALWVGVFTFTMVSTSFPRTTSAQEAPPLEEVRGDLLRLQNELRSAATVLTDICESLLRTHHFVAAREAKLKKSIFAVQHDSGNVEETCETCNELKRHAEQLSTQRMMGAIDPNDPLGSLMGTFNTSQLFQPEQQLWRSEMVAEHRFDHLVQGMVDYKRKVEAYLELKRDPLIQALVLSS